jgi:hypothetical protein
MTDMQRSRPAARPVETHPARPNSSKELVWLSWVLFVGILLFFSGFLTAMQGVVALANDDFYETAASGPAVDVNYTIWGWALLIVGAAMLVSGLGVVVGYPWARVVAVVVAVINALANLGFAAAYPLWTVIVVGLDVLAIYALVVHGGAARVLRTGRRS